MYHKGPRRRYPRTVALLWIVLLFCAALLYKLNILQIEDYCVSIRFHKRYLIENEGCKIPYFETHDRVVKKYILSVEKPNCAGGKPPLFDSNLTSIYLIESSLPFYDIKSVEKLSCCYVPFKRMAPKSPGGENDVMYSNNCWPFQTSVDIKKAFIKVSCFYDEEEIYRDYFAFVTLENKNKKNNTNNNRPNVLIIGIDGISRLNLHRQMKQTVEYLRNISAIEFFGFNKIGHNTFPNLVPVLSGLNQDELARTCWLDRNKFFDDCPFIWKTFSREGYTTAFGEDSSWMGVFSFAKRGFLHQPTDYYWNTFNFESEKRIGNHYKRNGYQCVGSRLVHETILDYTSKFVQTMHNSRKKYFGFFWESTLGHDYFNKPSIADGDYKKFFKNLKDTGKLDNTVLFFLSDHGMRHGRIRRSYQGRTETKLPFLYVILPEWFRASYPEAFFNMQINTGRLATPFDVYETLYDLVEMKGLATENNVTVKKRGYSLFRQIPGDRTCKDAEIWESCCACE